MNYDEFLHTKIEVAPVSGFEVKPEDINPALKPHQLDAVMWAIKGGRRALFESFGLGKTVQELEWCRLVAEHEQGKVIIVLPWASGKSLPGMRCSCLAWKFRSMCGPWRKRRLRTPRFC